jgi:hypothetical protein
MRSLLGTEYFIRDSSSPIILFLGARQLVLCYSTGGVHAADRLSNCAVLHDSAHQKTLLPFDPSADPFAIFPVHFEPSTYGSYNSGSVDGSRKYSPSKRGGWRGRRVRCVRIHHARASSVLLRKPWPFQNQATPLTVSCHLAFHNKPHTAPARTPARTIIASPCAEFLQLHVLYIASLRPSVRPFDVRVAVSCEMSFS